MSRSQGTHATPHPEFFHISGRTAQPIGQSVFMGRPGTTGCLGVRNRVGRIGLPTGRHDGVPLVLLSDIQLQQGSQLEGLVLKQGVGLDHEEGELSYQLALHQGQAGKLRVVDEALAAEDGVINAATWKNTGSAGHPANALLL